MPTAPARLCKRSGCRGLVHGSVCSVCGPVQTSGWSNRNGTRQSRGYGADWQRLRAAIIRHRKTEQGGVAICGDCVLPIIGRIHADHRIAFKGTGDPLRLDPDNVVLLCES